MLARTTARLVLERGPDWMELGRPSSPAARALFLQFKAGQTIDDDTISSDKSPEISHEHCCT
jgi:hypothetical protein